MPTVSVIVPAFNRTDFLQRAIESVAAQTFKDWELIVADDGSGADTQAYLRSLESAAVRIVWLAHCGNPSVVRNAALSQAAGRYVAFLDSDDLWDRVKLERQVAALQANSQARWSYTACRHIDAAGNVLNRGKRVATPQGWIFRALLTLQIGIAMPTVMAERSLLLDIGGFDEAQRFGEFHDLCLRLARQAPVVALDEPLSSVRLHDQHYSSDKIADRQGWMQLYAKVQSTTQDPDIRRLSGRLRADAALDLARAYGEKGRHGAAYAALGRAVAFSWQYPRWWLGAAKRILRPAIPDAWLSAWRRRPS